MSSLIYERKFRYVTSQLKRARLELNLSQVEVAKKLGNTQSYISKVESGQIRLDIVQLEHFAEVYKKKLNYFTE